MVSTARVTPNARMMIVPLQLLDEMIRARTVMSSSRKGPREDAFARRPIALRGHYRLLMNPFRPCVTDHGRRREWGPRIAGTATSDGCARRGRPGGTRKAGSDYSVRGRSR